MEPVSAIQTVIGGGLFLASGYAVSLAAFGKGEMDFVERAVFSLAFSITIPSIVLLFTSMVLKIRLDAIAVYAVYLLITVAGLGYWKYYGKHRHGHAAQA